MLIIIIFTKCTIFGNVITTGPKGTYVTLVFVSLTLPGIKIWLFLPPISSIIEHKIYRTSSMACMTFLVFNILYKRALLRASHYNKLFPNILTIKFTIILMIKSSHFQVKI